jgi:hypothetical protein
MVLPGPPVNQWFAEAGFAITAQRGLLRGEDQEAFPGEVRALSKFFDGLLRNNHAFYCVVTWYVSFDRHATVRQLADRQSNYSIHWSRRLCPRIHLPMSGSS